MESKDYRIVELQQLESESVKGGTWLSWIGGFIEGTIEYLGSSHATALIDSGNAPSVLAYK